MPRPRHRRVLAAVTALCCLLTACTATVGGSGRVEAGSDGLPSGVAPAPGPGGGSGPIAPPSAAPSPTPAPGPAQVDCPTVRDPQDGIAFGCVTGGLTRSADLVWTVNLSKNVETGWVLAEGASSVRVGSQIPLQQVTAVLREEMVALQSWGPTPGTRTLADAARTIAGVPGWVLETQFTIDDTFRAEHELAVRTERTWIVALRLDASRVALWYVTLPDQVRGLWASVPALIDGITRT